MKNKSNNITEEQKAKLEKAVAEKDHYEFEILMGELTLRQAAELSLNWEGSVDLAYMTWTVSEDWGFNVLWAMENLLPPEERNKEVDAPDGSTLDWDTPLGEREYKPFGVN
jgi:hypothetical protein